MTNRPVYMLVVDDDAANQVLNARATEASPRSLRLVPAGDGLDALEMLRSPERIARLGEPFVILLDMRMPRMCGLDFLNALRSDPQLCNIVVFAWSTSVDDYIIQTAYTFNIAGYFLKPIAYPDLEAMFKVLTEYCGLLNLPDCPQHD